MCIDIGATRLKWSVLPRAINGEDFPGMQTYSMRTLGWLNSSLEDLLDPDNWSGINHARRQLPAYDSIGIGICTQLTASGKIFGNLRGRGVPADLKERFERQTGKPVILMNDAEAWLPVRWLTRIRYATQTKLPRLKIPMLVMHSRADTLIPFGHGQKNFAAAQEPKMFWELKGDHNEALEVDRPGFRKGLQKFLKSLDPTPGRKRL